MKWVKPTYHVVSGHEKPVIKPDDRSKEVESVLALYGVPGEMISFDQGPIISAYGFTPKRGADVVKIMKQAENIALALDVEHVRMSRQSGLIMIEIPNVKRATIGLGYCLKNLPGSLPWVLGTDTQGDVKIADLAKMPHLLIAGQTGSGKSVAVNAALCGLITKYDPSELSLILIDPKQVEFAIYRDLPHLSCAPITDPGRAAMALDQLVQEMETRLKTLAQNHCRSIDEYNGLGKSKLPRIVCVIDEFSDLMMVARKQVETSIVRLAQMARAVGIHLVIATQRPDSATVTGSIKSNLPAKIAYRVSTGINSKIVIDQSGAETLSGMGDGLYMGPGTAEAERIHAPYASTSDVNALISHYSAQDIPRPQQSTESPQNAEYRAIIEEFGGLPPAKWLQRTRGIGFSKAMRLRQKLKAFA